MAPSTVQEEVEDVSLRQPSGFVAHRADNVLKNGIVIDIDSIQAHGKDLFAFIVAVS